MDLKSLREAVAAASLDLCHNLNAGAICGLKLFEDGLEQDAGHIAGKGEAQGKPEDKGADEGFQRQRQDQNGHCAQQHQTDGPGQLDDGEDQGVRGVPVHRVGVADHQREHIGSHDQHQYRRQEQNARQDRCRHPLRKAQDQKIVAHHGGGKNGNHQPHRRGLPEVIPECPEEGPDDAVVLVQDHGLGDLVQCRRGCSHGDQGHAADQKQKIDDDHIAHAGQKLHKGAFDVEKFFHGILLFAQVE